MSRMSLSRKRRPLVVVLAIGFSLAALPLGANAAPYNPGSPGSDPRDHLPNDPGYASHETSKFPDGLPQQRQPL